MSNFTYDLDTDIGKIRFEIGDTDPDYAQFSDAEVQVKLDSDGTVLEAAAALCDILSTRYARRPDFSVDGQQFKSSQISEAYAKRAKDLRQRGENSMTVFHVTRVDGYTDGIAADSNERSGALDSVYGAGNDFDAGRIW